MLPVANPAKVENVLQVREHVSDNATGHGGAGLGQGLSLLPRREQAADGPDRLMVVAVGIVLPVSVIAGPVSGFCTGVGSPQ